MAKLATDGRPLPSPTPTTQAFFDAAKDRRLILPHCPRKGYFFYPRSHCPCCLKQDWDWKPASGRGTVYAFTVDRMGHDPNLMNWVPYDVAAIELEEGPRMTAIIVDCVPEDVRVGMPVEASYEDIDDVTIVRFRLA